MNNIDITQVRKVESSTVWIIGFAFISPKKFYKLVVCIECRTKLRKIVFFWWGSLGVSVVDLMLNYLHPFNPRGGWYINRL